MDKNESIRETVRKGYGEIAKGNSCCCGSSKSSQQLAEGIGYTKDELAILPEGANMGLSCGNPTALANLKAGQVVLDLGSGGGFDCFIAAKKVAPNGKAIGVDMTADMLAKARAGIAKFTEKTGLDNVEFRLGEIEHLPVADDSVDVIISNCVVNLSPAKQQVWNEIGRVLKPGGKACVSDLALKESLPQEVLKSAAAVVSCVAGAVLIDDTIKMAQNAGLSNIKTEEKKYNFDVLEDCSDPLYKEVKKIMPEGKKISDYIVSVNFIAEKPSESLSNKHKELIAIGASFTAHCQPCLIYHFDKARETGASEREINLAVSVGKAVQKGSDSAIENFIEHQLGKSVQAHESICQQANTEKKKCSGNGKSSCCSG
ncbi:MAG: arsenite methyltransferase [Phycisphaerales bacterium]